MHNLRYRIEQFMYGRYGYDELSKFLLILGFVFSLIYCVISIPLFYILSLLSFVYALFRTFSKNTYKRQAELNSYYKQKNKINRKIVFRKELREMKKTHCLFKCKNCKTILRVPKGVGKVKITCQKCKTVMIKNT